MSLNKQNHLLELISPEWESDTTTHFTIPPLYTELLINKPYKININLDRNSQIGLNLSFSLEYQHFNIKIEYNSYHRSSKWIGYYTRDKNGINHLDGWINNISEETNNALFYLIPKSLKNIFKDIIYTHSFYNKWYYLYPLLDEYKPSKTKESLIPTIFNFRLLQHGNYPGQIKDSKYLNKTYFYEKI